MTRTIPLHPLSLLVGVGLALLGLVAMGQAPVSRAPGTGYAAASPIHGVWNPHPRDMVQFYPPGVSPTGGPNSSVTIPVNGEHEVFTVPTDRWLVILPTGPGDLGLSGGGAVLYEDRGGQLIEKGWWVATGIASRGPGGSIVGWTFSPGSRVIIRCYDPSFAISVQYNFFGYTTGL